MFRNVPKLGGSILRAFCEDFPRGALTSGEQTVNCSGNVFGVSFWLPRPTLGEKGQPCDAASVPPVGSQSPSLRVAPRSRRPSLRPPRRPSTREAPSVQAIAASL